MKKIFITLTFMLAATIAYAQETFRNPVVWADMPDPDIIRTGSDFWLVTSTMHMMPGAPVMHSKDLVNWETVSYLFNRLDENPRYSMQGGTVYGRGQGATSIRYHKGTFYAMFSPDDAPFCSLIFTAKDPRQGWALHSRLPYFKDASLFFDDDGRAYVFSETGKLTELNTDLTGTKKDGIDITLNVIGNEENNQLNGSRMIKHEGRYYLLMMSWPKDKPRRQVCYRADNIAGPYEKKVILEDNFAGFPYAGQGTIVDDGQGNWYGLIVQDRGAAGRVPLLMPCRWTDGWPMLGDVNGKVPLVMNKPLQGFTDTDIVVSDDFNGDTLDLKHWQWNHTPANDFWKIADGQLQLKTCRMVDNIYMAPNTLTQRMEGPKCSAHVEINFSHMKDGDRAGLAAFNGHSGIMTIEKDSSRTWLTVTQTQVNLTQKERMVSSVDTHEKARIGITGNRIFLRIDGDFNLGRDIATFYYSTDGKKWTAIGGEFKMKFDHTRLFMGTRYALFNYSTKQPGGYIDIEKFTYKKENK